MTLLTHLCLGRDVWRAGLSRVPLSFHVVSGPLHGVSPVDDMKTWQLITSIVYWLKQSWGALGFQGTKK